MTTFPAYLRRRISPVGSGIGVHYNVSPHLLAGLGSVVSAPRVRGAGCPTWHGGRLCHCFLFCWLGPCLCVPARVNRPSCVRDRVPPILLRFALHAPQSGLFYGGTHQERA